MAMGGLQNMRALRLSRPDATGLVLLLSNLVAIIMAIILNYSFGVIIWVYFLESVFIGASTVATIVLTGLRNRRFLQKAAVIGGFFTFHYGFFHFVGFIFLLNFTFTSILIKGPLNMGLEDLLYILLTAGILFLSHSFSFLQNIVRGHERIYWDPEKDIDDTFWKPYLRVVPMHITIVLAGFMMFFGWSSTPLLVLFMGLKALVDLVAHQAKHHPKPEK